MKRIIVALSLGMVLLLVMIWASSLGPPVQMGVGQVYADATPVSVESIILTGLTPTMNTASSDAEGNTFVNNGRTFVYVTNGYTATLTATFVTPITVNGLAVDDLTVTVAAAANAAVGPFQPETFNTTTGKCQITWATAGAGSVADITFGVMAW